jgi:hypothetical protein
MGTVVFGGMLSSTLLAIPFVPVFYVLMERVSERLRRGKTPLPPRQETTSVEGGKVWKQSEDIGKP